jgi:SAM-dependent methyltransferase
VTSAKLTHAKTDIGVHYTPAEFAVWFARDCAEIARDCVGLRGDYANGLRILDPACGNGSLLAAIDLEFPGALLIGTDIDPEAVRATKERLPHAQVSMQDALFGHIPCAHVVVMNPPFLGGSKISSRLGPDYQRLVSRRWSMHGNADLCAYFLHVAAASGAQVISVIATNTIAQGDTRQSGLARLLNNGWAIAKAWKSIPWPGDAAVMVSVVHLACGNPSRVTRRQLNGVPARNIDSRLDSRSERRDPTRLTSNAGLSFLGTKVYGQGFTLTPEERAALIEQNPKNAQRIFPYLGGEEVNTSPTQSHHRYVINFGRMELQEAEQWPDLLQIVREKVKPERDRLRDNADGRRRKQYWWQFGRWTPALYEALKPLKRCLVTAIVSKHLILSFQPTNRIFAHKLYVFPFDSNTHFAILQSRIHVPWARLLSSTLETRLNYSASDCFETFPFPHPDPRAVLPELEVVGAALDEARAAFMLETAQGLTKTYNALKDPACTDQRILHLRKLHERLDRAVLDAYGWGELEVPAYCPRTDAEQARVRAFGDELIERLFALNETRHKEEMRRI